ncbi:MAG: YceI family protein [Anaerolineae bacterium]|nr:YceI family protein [Anaerolineae bacterium]
MSRQNIIFAIFILIAFGLGVGAGALGLLWSTGGLETESAPISEVAPTLSLDDPPPTQNTSAFDDLNSRLDTISGQLDNLSTAVAAGAMAAATTDSAVEPTATPEAADSAAAGDAPERTLFRISQDDSQVRFIIDEVLAGNPNTVIAATNSVAGDIIVNFSDPSASQIGQIAINARTFVTDNEFRDDSIRGRILRSSDFEFITFAPTALEGLPSEPVEPGATLDFQIVGDLTVKGVTRPMTFDTTVTLVDATHIEGTARAQTRYPDFEITIRTPPLVSSVEEDVILEIDFVANAVTE